MFRNFFPSGTILCLILNTGAHTERKKAYIIQLLEAVCLPLILPGSQLVWTLGEKHANPLGLNSLIFLWKVFT